MVDEANDLHGNGLVHYLDTRALPESSQNQGKFIYKWVPVKVQYTLSTPLKCSVHAVFLCRKFVHFRKPAHEIFKKATTYTWNRNWNLFFMRVYYILTTSFSCWKDHSPTLAIWMGLIQDIIFICYLYFYPYFPFLLILRWKIIGVWIQW